MDNGNVGQYIQLLEGLQQLWHNPQLQQLYHLHAAQRTHNTQQMGSCLTNIQPPPPSTATFAFEYPASQTSPHLQHFDLHNQTSPSQGLHNQTQSWQWPSQPQPTTHDLPHFPHHLTSAPEWTFPPAMSHPQSDPQYRPPPDFPHDLRQHFSTIPRYNIPDMDIVGPDRDPNTNTRATRHSIIPESKAGRTGRHSTLRSPTEEGHSPRSYAEQHPRTKYEEPQEGDASSQSDSNSRHGKKRRGRHKRPRENSSRRRHKRRRKHSSSSYSSHSTCQHTQRECLQTQHHSSHMLIPIRRRRRNTHVFAVQKEERWLTLSHTLGKKTTSPPTGGILCDCIRTVLNKGGFVAIPCSYN